MDSKSKSFVALIFEDLESLRPSPEVVEKKMIGLWLPGNYKERFDILQAKTKTEFGKKIQEIIMEAIDQVDGKL